MASNAFGTVFKITTWGESHGKAIGVVIDGCPAGLEISDDEINQELMLRQPGKTPYTSPRQEKDLAEILSGTFEGKTTGAPLSIIIYNKDADSSKYAPIKDLLRPGHANYTYLQKYDIFDWRGGGRSSARETACRVAAGAVAKKLLAHFGISTLSYVTQVENVSAIIDPLKISRDSIYESPIFCPDPKKAQEMMQAIELAKSEKDSVGALIEFAILNLPVGLGDPVYEKIEAKLAQGMLTLPATKGFEIGSGFEASKMRGSNHNDIFYNDQGRIKTHTNFSGGTLGGISNGMPVIGRVAFKPTSSIEKNMKTLTIDGKKANFQLPEGSRHDPCVAIRAVPIVEAMSAIVTADLLLYNRCVKL